MKEDILTQIIANKRKEISRQMEAVSMKQLEAIVAMRKTREPLSLSRSIMSSPTGIISEFKRRSPSKGWINREADVRLITGGYAEAGAAGLSVLTDTDFFGGSEGDLVKARLSAPSTPILRKDFIISEYQILQSVAIQADAILLIAAALEKDECRHLAEMAHRLGLEVLLEIHSEDELEYVTDCIDLIGVNNRDLGSFHRIPHGRIIHEDRRTGHRTENTHRRTGNSPEAIKSLDAISVTRTCNGRNTDVSHA